MKNNTMRYRLGIDVGVASLGIAILRLKDTTNAELGEPDYEIVGGNVRTYPIPEGAKKRREKRSMRRNINVTQRRLDRLSDLLAKHNIGHPRKKMPKELLDLSPVKLRAQASRECIPLDRFARALLHIARHRGSSAIRESGIKDEKESRQTADGIKALRAEMDAKGFDTYGQYLRWREKPRKGQPTMPTRINQTRLASGKEGYAYYPSREMLREEFRFIWDKQASYHDELTDVLKKEVERKLFFQRFVTAPPPGKCPYFPEKDRLPKSSRLFQTRRIYEAANHLRMTNKAGETITYDKAARDKIVAHLMAGEDLKVTEIKNILDLKSTDKVSIADGVKIAGYPFVKLGTKEVLGDVWNQATDEKQDEILHVIAHIHNDEKAIDALSDILDGDRTAAKRVLETPLPSGWGRMGLEATTRILTELKKDVIAARIAEERAGLKHASTPDGVIYERLPYYGEILVAHTAAPIWVSGRRDADSPPATDPLEYKFGRIPNPVVHLALRQIQLVVNQVVDTYGVPESIHIELARDLNKSAEERAAITKEINDNQKANEKIDKELKSKNVRVNRLNLQKYKLWKEQGGKCIYTGDCISLTQLYTDAVDVDHILPRSKTFSDSMANKVVCLRRANADKSNRPPFDAFSGNPAYDWNAILRRVENLPDIKKWNPIKKRMKKLPNSKKWRFNADAMERFESDPKKFKARYGDDNAYTAKVARQYLSCLYGEDSKVIAVSSHIVAMLRGKWGLSKVLGTKENGKKNRDDHRHHFIDALVTACTTRGMVQRIMHEAARTEKQGLAEFIERIAPPFGAPKEFFAAAREATFERVTLSRKADHSTSGQLHEDTLLGIVAETDEADVYVCRVTKKLTDYASFAALETLEKVQLQAKLPDLPKIIQARADLDTIKTAISSLCTAAEQELEAERQADIKQGKKGKKISPNAIYARAVEKHKAAGGKTKFKIYKNQKLVNVRRADGGNRPTGGYIGGRNHRMDFYLDGKGKLKWQIISMLEANDPNFMPQAKQPECQLLWSAHKEDVLLMNDPDDPQKRCRMIVAKMKDGEVGIVRDTEARDSKERKLWEKGLSFFQKHEAQRVVTDALGQISWYFPKLPPAKKSGSGKSAKS